MKSFTITEIRNYLVKQDSRGDIMHNLSEENIEKANQPEPTEEDCWDGDDSEEGE